MDILLRFVGCLPLAIICNPSRNTYSAEYEMPSADTAKNAGHEVVGVRGFAGEISEAKWMESRKSNGAIDGFRLR
jgi:hypothetical protein